MCMVWVTIVIEFGGPAWAPRPERDAPFGAPIRLVESEADAARAFTLYHGNRSVYTLTAGETDELLSLLGQMEVKAPWGAMIGFDGCTYTMKLIGPMSDVTFSWWMEVPKGWESVGAVADYVLSLVDRLGLSRYG